ncbi:MAG: hypothetical protein JXM70_05450 [Pirellulales bacterium]|nr:hypothetical protein [Pirellulales bacterium]
MRNTVLSTHQGLAGTSRLRVLSRDGQWSDTAALLILFGAGASAALATVFLDMSLRIPGHAILRCVFPMALGLALAPRRMGGMVMGFGAIGTVLVIKAGGLGSLGSGALTSLVLTGPFLDAALWRARSGWRLYMAFALAGLGSNMAALIVRGGAKFAGLNHVTSWPLAVWLPRATVSYAVCGILAGLISATIWFKLSSSPPGTKRTESVS